MLSKGSIVQHSLKIILMIAILSLFMVLFLEIIVTCTIAGVCSGISVYV